MLREVLSGLDTRTLFAILTMVHLGNLGFSLLFFTGKKRSPGTRSWIWGQAFGVLATILLPWLGRSIGPAVLLALPNTLYYLSGLFLLDAVWRFRHSRRMPWPLWATAILFLAGFAALALGGATANQRVIFYSAWMGGLSLASGLVLALGMDKALRFPALLAAATFLANLPFHVLRALGALAAPPWPDLGFHEPGQAAFYLVSILSAYLLLLAFVLLSSMRQALELRELNRTQLVMLQVIAHDLRNPIGGAARYVRKHLAPPGIDLSAKREAIVVLGKTLAETDRLLENLLMWANARTGFDKARKPALVDLDGLLLQCLDLHAEAARDKGIALCLEPRGRSILAEPNGSSLVVRNLLSNALKFTPPGGRVWIDSRRSGPEVLVTIGDTGLGMDGQRLKAFREGRDVPSSLGTEGEKGSGLGISLCKRFLEDQGGRLEVESSPGQGTVFTLAFPGPRP